MITVTLYYHVSMIVVITGWVGFVFVKSIIEILPLS